MHENFSVNKFAPISTVDTHVWEAYVNSEIIIDANFVSVWVCVDTRRIGAHLCEYFILVTNA